MKSRWGSCNPKKSYINLNQELIKKPKKAIEYVVLHEIAHLKHHNHDFGFYNYLSSYMPDWKDVMEKLDFV
jgi:predicted metal-dependent hydrolase